MKIIIASFWSRALDLVAELSWPAKEEYAKRHGYQAIKGYHPEGIDVMWDRPRQWANVLDQAEDGDWCLFLGCDTTITRLDLLLENWIDNDFDALLSVDHYVVFGDVHMWKASPATRKFMRAIADRNEAFGKVELTEQDAFTSALACSSRHEYQMKARYGCNYGSPEYYANAQTLLNKNGLKVKLVNCTNFTGDDPAQWPPGDIPPYHSWTKDHLILHMGGISNERRINLMKSLQCK